MLIHRQFIETPPEKYFVFSILLSLVTGWLSETPSFAHWDWCVLSHGSDFNQRKEKCKAGSTLHSQRLQPLCARNKALKLTHRLPFYISNHYIHTIIGIQTIGQRHQAIALKCLRTSAKNPAPQKTQKEAKLTADTPRHSFYSWPITSFLNPHITAWLTSHHTYQSPKLINFFKKCCPNFIANKSENCNIGICPWKL